MKRFLCCVFSLSFASLGYAQDAGPEGVYYIPGMPVPQFASPETPTTAAPAATPGSQGRISRVTVSGAAALEQKPETPQASKTPQASASPSEYRGVTPPKRIVPENAQTFVSSKNQVAWIGFQPSSTQHSVFIQTTQPTVFEQVESSDKRVVIQLPDTALLVSNNARELDMRYFNTPFALAKASRQGKHARVVIEFKEKTAFEIVAHDNFIEIRTASPALKLGAKSEAQ